VPCSPRSATTGSSCAPASRRRCPATATRMSSTTSAPPSAPTSTFHILAELRSASSLPALRLERLHRHHGGGFRLQAGGGGAARCQRDLDEPAGRRHADPSCKRRGAGQKAGAGPSFFFDLRSTGQHSGCKVVSAMAWDLLLKARPRSYLFAYASEPTHRLADRSRP
jgi:hypothetical protein